MNDKEKMLERQREYRKKYYEANKEKISKKRKEWYREHREEIKAKKREQGKSNPERIMRARLSSAANLLYKNGLLEEQKYTEIKERINNK